MDYPEAPIWEKANEESGRLERELDTGEECYLLRIWGGNTKPEFTKEFGQPNEVSVDGSSRAHAFWFESAEARKAFKARVRQFCFAAGMEVPVLSDQDGPLLRKNVTAIVTLRYQGKEYEVKKGYGYGYPLSTVIFDWEENNTSCDCNRLLLIDRFHPGALSAEDAQEGRGCSDGHAVVTAFRFELTD